MWKSVYTLFALTWVVTTWGQTYFLNGNASFLGNDCYQVTAASVWQNGTVWYSDQLDLLAPFELEFDMFFGTIDETGADGMAFVLQTVGTGAIGISGGGMGYQGFNPSFGIEFDTYFNSDVNDPDYDHVAFLKNGNIAHNNPNNLAGPVAATPTQGNIEDGQSHQIKITWEPQGNWMSLYVDCVLRITAQVDLVATIFQGQTNVFWGFTGATGGLFNEQRVCLDQIINNAPSDYSVCAGETVQLSANGSLAAEISWSPALGLDNPNSFQPYATPSITTEYCYTYTDFCGETTTTCSMVNVAPLPNIQLVADTIFCADENLTVPVQVENAGEIEWTLNGNILVNGSNAQNLICGGSGVYLIEASNAVTGCSKIDSVEVEVISLPDFDPESQWICPFEQIQLIVPNTWQVLSWWNGSSNQSVTVDIPGNYIATIEAFGCTADVSFEVSLWNVPTIDLGPDLDWCLQAAPLVIDAGVDVTWSDGTQSSEITIDSSQQLIGTWTNGDCFISDTLNIVITIPPVVTLSGTGSLCEGEVGLLQSSHIGWWNTDEVANQITIAEPGLYSLTHVLGPCEVITLFSVEALPDPQVDLGVDRLLCFGESLELVNFLDQTAFTTIWNTGEQESSVQIDEAGLYSCEVQNNCGSATDSISIYMVECESSIYIPNSFTPNNDGINDIWNVDGVNIHIKEIFITNRWGHRVFQTTEPVKPWLGDNENGEFFASADAYIFTVRYTNKAGDDLEERGVVLLIR